MVAASPEVRAHSARRRRAARLWRVARLPLIVVAMGVLAGMVLMLFVAMGGLG